MNGDDLEREVLRLDALAVLRELARGAVSDEIRLQAALGLVEWATKQGWHEDARAALDATTTAKGNGRGWRTGRDD